MTKVVFYKSNDIYWGFEEQGHSGFASSGDDILCSVVVRNITDRKKIYYGKYGKQY